MQRPPLELPPADYKPPEKNLLHQPGSTNLEQDCLVTDEHHAGDCGVLLPEDIYEMIRVQYQEALYISKTSLAYFAKGPLSRARAAFLNQAGSSPMATDLIRFLRTVILSLSSLDTKYRDALPSLVQNLPAGDFSEEELGQVTVFLGDAGRKLKRRKKVGKNGLFPGEELYLAKWWVKRDLSAGGDESRDAELKRLLIEQRVRETELQIIIILETLGLEALEANMKTNEDSSTTVAKDEDDSQLKKKKRKKAQDLNTILELLMDRLCIWQSMGHDDSKPSETNTGAAFKQCCDNTAMKKQGSDRLRDFCAEVVVPFYGARLPDLSATICQKLGGPTIPSPVRKPLAKAASTSHVLPRPGAPMQRPQMRKPRKTLERVLTDEASAPQRPQPSLLRSATDSMIPRLKRETSDISLAAIPLDRVGIQKSKRLSQREVDLSAVSQVTEAKLKKKASVEQELKGAIAALKRPNPRLAVKELMESAERRAAGSGSNARSK
ncbi:DNA replication regulator Sld3 [Lasallia pustulata]|uniref:DNA replication regulator Sld3 n=1 Tax=Lasallia pustulata TaxID=136370 RepID=A0A1W5DDB5_9LECA|nr:DNA replication regulator Sld3 [Lasallia pustulata]